MAESLAMQAEVRREISRALLIQSGWTLAFLATLAGAVAIVLRMPELGATRTAVILLPLLPAAGIFRFALRQFRRGDEMHRRNQLEAVAAAFAAMLLLMLAYTLLEVIGWPRLPMWIPLAVAQAVWTIAIWIQYLRFR